jgi:hypothetical protein
MIQTPAAWEHPEQIARAGAGRGFVTGKVPWQKNGRCEDQHCDKNHRLNDVSLI